MKDFTSSFEKLLGFIYHTFLTLIPAAFLMTVSYLIIKYYALDGDAFLNKLTNLLPGKLNIPIWVIALIIAFVLTKIIKSLGIFVNYYLNNFQVYTERIMEKSRLYNPLKKKIETELEKEINVKFDDIPDDEQKKFFPDNYIQKLSTHEKGEPTKPTIELQKVNFKLLNKELYSLIIFDMVSKQQQYHLLYEESLAEEYIYTSINIVLQMIALLYFPLICGKEYNINSNTFTSLYLLEIILVITSGWAVQKCLLYKIKGQKYAEEGNPLRFKEKNTGFYKSSLFVIIFSLCLLTSTIILGFNARGNYSFTPFLTLFSLNLLLFPMLVILHIKAFGNYLYVECLFIDLLIQRRYGTEITNDRDRDFENKLKVDAANKQ